MNTSLIKKIVESENMETLEKPIAVSQVLREKNVGYWENRSSW